MAATPAFATWTPNIINTGSNLYISIPMGNTGSATASTVWLTGGTLGSAARVSPATFRIFIGNLAVGNNASVNMIFSATGLTVGSKYLLTIRGTYVLGAEVLAFSLNRFIVVPAVTSLPVALLDAALSVSISPDSWSYTVTNNEPVGSTLYVSSFSIDVAAPVSITGTPAGWIGKTDNASYVAWYANDASLPYPDQVAPGAKLSGFAIESSATLSRSTAYIVTSWDHALDETGLVFSDYISSPSQT